MSLISDSTKKEKHGQLNFAQRDKHRVSRAVREAHRTIECLPVPQLSLRTLCSTAHTEGGSTKSE